MLWFVYMSVMYVVMYAFSVCVRDARLVYVLCAYYVMYVRYVCMLWAYV